MIYLFLVYITTLGYVLRLWDIDYYAVYVMSLYIYGPEPR
jgi:hypothetical protein